METSSTARTPGRGRFVERVLLGSILAMQIAILFGIFHLRGRMTPAVGTGVPDNSISRNESLWSRGGAGHNTSPAGSPSGGDSSAPSRAQTDDGSAGGKSAGASPPAFRPSWPMLYLHPAHVAPPDMDALWEQAMSDFEQMESFMRHLDDGWESAAASPAMDMREEPGRYVVVFSLPGLDRSNITVNLEGRLLTVSSKTTDQARSHFSTYSFERRVLLPGPVKEGTQAQATLSNGVLRVRVPKGSDEAN